MTTVAGLAWPGVARRRPGRRRRTRETRDEKGPTDPAKDHRRYCGRSPGSNEGLDMAYLLGAGQGGSPLAPHPVDGRTGRLFVQAIHERPPVA